MSVGADESKNVPPVRTVYCKDYHSPKRRKSWLASESVPEEVDLSIMGNGSGLAAEAYSRSPGGHSRRK